MKVPWLDSLPPRRRRIVLWTVGLVLFYTVVGFLILPPIVRSVAAKRLSKELNREVSIAKVKLNPYAMSATIRGFVIKDKDGQPFVSWDEVYANFQFFSLLTRTFVFKEIRTSQPYLRVQLNKDYTLNFSDILEKIAREASAAPPRKKPSKPRGLRIDQLKISGARMAATDLTTKQPYSKIVGPLELTLQNFATHPDNMNPYSFSGSTEDGEKFSWSGYFFLEPIRSTGEFALEDISLVKYAPLYQELVRFDIRDGTVGLKASYFVQQSAQTNAARVTNATVTVRSLKVAEPGAADNAIEVPLFTIGGASGDAFGRTADVQSISTSGGRFAVRRNADASINLIELSKPSVEATNAAGSIAILLQSLTNVVELLLRSTNAWQGTVHEINVENYAARLEDFSTTRPVRVDVDNVHASLRNLSNLPGSNILADVSLRWNTNGTIKTETALSLFPVQAAVKLALNNLEIRALDPYLDPFLNLLVTKGTVGLDGLAELVATTNGLPEVSFQGDMRVDDFATVDGVMTEDFLKCEHVRLSGIEARLNPLELSVNRVYLEQAYARLVIATEKTNNLFAVLRRTDSQPPASTNVPPPATRKITRGMPKFSLPTNLLASAEMLPKIRIGSVILSNAQLNYVDRSIKPNVALAVGQVSGSISGLSSEELARADVRLTGKVDNTAPMEITGKINPLTKNEFTDVKIAFRGIELVPTSPYAGKFIGYRLTKGKLSLDLHYELAEGRLKGQNIVTLDQLTLGEKVESPDATKLPVKLGIAILKDRSGKIDLNVPVEGSLGDPEFKLGKVITRALVNVVSKIVTSPFAALGSLFGGKGEEVSYQDFAPGSFDLQPSNKEKLDTLAKGLFERPGLQLEVEGSIDTATDRDALRRLKLEKEFRAKKWTSLRKSERSRLTPDQVELTPDEYNSYLKQAYATAFSPEAVTARAQKAGTGAIPETSTKLAADSRTATSPRGTAFVRASQPDAVKGATALLSAAKPRAPKLPRQDMEGQLLEIIEVTESDFALLATERAKKVKEYILQTGKVEPERVFLAEKAENAEGPKGSRVYLHLR